MQLGDSSLTSSKTEYGQPQHIGFPMITKRGEIEERGSSSCSQGNQYLDGMHPEQIGTKGSSLKIRTQILKMAVSEVTCLQNYWLWISGSKLGAVDNCSKLVTKDLEQLQWFLVDRTPFTSYVSCGCDPKP